MFVVPASTGSNATKQTVRSIMAIIERRKVKAGQNPHPQRAPQTLNFSVTAHQLRHTYITRLCESGMNVKQIQYLAGHATISMTLNIYAHVTNNRPEQLIGAVEQAFTLAK